MDHYGRFAIELEVKRVKVVISGKLASNRYAKVSLLTDPANMDPKCRAPPKGIKPKEAWQQTRVPLDPCCVPGVGQ